MQHNTTVKRAVLIGKTVEVRDSFSFTLPPSFLRALEIFFSSNHGSLEGWEPEGAEAQKFFGVWRLNVLLTHNLPRAKHRYFLPMLPPGAVSASGEIVARFVSFFRGLRKAPIQEVVSAALFLARDRRSKLGKNLAYVESQTGQDPWTASPELVRRSAMEREVVEPPPQDAWRLTYLAKLLRQWQQLHRLGLKVEEERVQQLIDSLCIN